LGGGVFAPPECAGERGGQDNGERQFPVHRLGSLAAEHAPMAGGFNSVSGAGASGIPASLPDSGRYVRGVSAVPDLCCGPASPINQLN
jgi:hypothetical protein